MISVLIIGSLLWLMSAFGFFTVIECIGQAISGRDLSGRRFLPLRSGYDSLFVRCSRATMLGAQ